ncbi:L-2-hydroxyglutarate dehydrogenase [Citrus sinensis]|uniref:L-2-hydroxyglutarate dehydrogenase n=1 Tax=Citrus sinensis TaxID=2711 RepID=A0ACB8K1I1_CITSI|nr:L-2-hydroxyglutarate dehydrogenase [Citrus sinensis]
MSTTTAAAPAAKEKVDCVVIGAGVVGIAVARELALKGREVLVLDSGPTFGTGTSSRNSEVIHAGIYYPLNSLKVKAIFCVRGRELLYKYCSEHEVPHKQIGKLIVATRPLEIPKLNDLMKRGTANGVHGLRMLEGFEAMKMEPELQCVKALLSPASGIVDSHSLMLSLVPELTLIPKLVVNSAGLSAPALAKRFIGLDNVFIPPAYYARGCYFSLANTKVAPFKHLIYPIPEDGGLGVHVTLDLDGQIKFGPDVEWIDGIDDTLSFLNRFDYSVNANRAERFYPEIRKYYPDLRDGSLQPSYAGIRPKLSGPRQSPIDFIIQGEDTHGVPGLVNLFGIESPGLTSSMAIAEYVAAKFLR